MGRRGRRVLPRKKKWNEDNPKFKTSKYETDPKVPDLPV